METTNVTNVTANATEFIRRDFCELRTIGFLSQDSKLVQMQNSDKAVLYFTVAVNEGYKTADGKNAVSFIECALYGKMATQKVADVLRKGMRVHVEGRLSCWTEKKGEEYNNRYIVRVSGFDLLTPKTQSQQMTPPPTQAPVQQAPVQQVQAQVPVQQAPVQQVPVQSNPAGFQVEQNPGGFDGFGFEGFGFGA